MQPDACPRCLAFRMLVASVQCVNSEDPVFGEEQLQRVKSKGLSVAKQYPEAGLAGDAV